MIVFGQAKTLIRAQKAKGLRFSPGARAVGSPH